MERTQAHVFTLCSLCLCGSTAFFRVIEIADREKRVVVTKDDDFVQSYLVTGHPERLPLVSTGNTSNDVLEQLVRTHVGTIASALAGATFVELGRNALTVHE